jgi:hypothetical protein
MTASGGFRGASNSNARERQNTIDGVSLDAPLLADLDLSPDLKRLVERVCQNRQPWVVVVTAALTAWQERDPAGWEKVSEWLTANGVVIVRI